MFIVKPILAAVLCAVLLTHPGSGQTVVVFGQVANAGVPAAGLTVSLVHQEIGRIDPVATDGLGRFVIPRVPVQQAPYYLEIYWGPTIVRRDTVRVDSSAAEDGRVRIDDIALRRRGSAAPAVVAAVPTPPARPDTIVRYDSTFVFDSTVVHDSVRVEYPLLALAKDTVLFFDTLVVHDTLVLADTVATSWRFGVGVGFASLNTGGYSFRAPGIGLLGARGRAWYLTLAIGYRPGGGTSSDSLFAGDTGDRQQTMLALTLSHYPNAGWIGGAAGFSGSWESIPEFDEYLRRAGGITVGPRARLGLLADRADVVLGVDFQLSNISEFGRPGEKTLAPGLAVRITFNYVFR